MSQDFPKEVVHAYEAAKKIRDHAHAPYSKFLVGAAVKLKGMGDFILGCNVENASIGATVCAERNAIGQMVALGDNREAEFVVVVTQTETPAYPCGLCRQVLVEFFPASLPIYVGNLKELVGKSTLGELYPHAYNCLEC